MSDLIKLTGLWKSKTKAGASMLSGSLNPITQILVMANTFKKSEHEPDYFLYLRPKEKDAAQAPKPPAGDDLGF